MRKLRPREFKGPAQSQLSNKLQSWELTPACTVVSTVFFPILEVVCLPCKGTVRASGKQVTIHVLSMGKVRRPLGLSSCRPAP